MPIINAIPHPIAGKISSHGNATNSHIVAPISRQYPNTFMQEPYYTRLFRARKSRVLSNLRCFSSLCSSPSSKDVFNLLTTLLPTCVNELGTISLTRWYAPLSSALNPLFSPIKVLGRYQSFLTRLFTRQCRITITPLSKGITNFLAMSIFKSSSPAPTIRMTFFGPTNPSSSACIPRWKYSACDELGMSRNKSLATTLGLNILLAMYLPRDGHALSRTWPSPVLS